MLNGRDVNTLKIAADRMRDRVPLGRDWRSARTVSSAGPAIRTSWIRWSGSKAHGVEKMKIAFIGLGNMGTGIAQCILKSGHDLIVWNRTATKTVSVGCAGCPGRNDGPRSRRGRRCRHHEFDGRQVRAGRRTGWRRHVGRDAARRGSCSERQGCHCCRSTGSRAAKFGYRYAAADSLWQQGGRSEARRPLSLGWMVCPTWS